MEILVSLYDRKARVYNRPYSVPNTTTAIRQFVATVNDPQNGKMLRDFPNDYELRHIANIDYELDNPIVKFEDSSYQMLIDVHTAMAVVQTQSSSDSKIS